MGRAISITTQSGTVNMATVVPIINIGYIIRELRAIGRRFIKQSRSSYDGPMTRYVRLSLQLLLLLLLPLNVLAQTGRPQSKPLFAGDLSSTITGTKTTYLELIRKIIPDLKIDPNDADVAIAHKTIPFKHLSENTPAAALESDIKLDSFQPVWIKSDGRQVLLLELSLSAPDANQGTNYEGEADIVAAFTMQP